VTRGAVQVPSLVGLTPTDLRRLFDGARVPQSSAGTA
jgi:hypothetical protein